MKPSLVLASQSPRRRELLSILGIPFEVIPADIPEIPGSGESPEQFVVRAAREKGIEVGGRVSSSIVLSADTVVTVDGLILGKPVDETHAVRMLGQLSGRKHAVYTAVCVIDQIHDQMYEALEKTDVWFRSMTEAEIMDYVRREDVFDKAGAYAIQGYAGVYISKIEGNYGNVMGLPLPVVHDFLRRTTFFF
ncbi:MAG TPA: Maf family protein [Terriglobia bacterium]|nr:Maf family protein [Terriglobia bacterium]